MRRGHLPFEPIAKAIEARGGFGPALDAAAQRARARGDHALADDLTRTSGHEGQTARRLRRAHERGVKRKHASGYVIDELCVLVLGKHPTELYGYDFYRAWDAHPRITNEEKEAA